MGGESVLPANPDWGYSCERKTTELDRPRYVLTGDNKCMNEWTWVNLE